MSQFLPILTAFCLGGSALAAEYFVSPEGDDSNPGTREQPWRSIDRVNEVVLQPGDAILFKAGFTFPGSLMLGRTDSGTPERAVDITSYGNGRATIDGGNGSAITARACDFLTVKNINVAGDGRKNGNNGSGVHIVGATGTRIQDVETYGFRNSGILVEGVRKARVEHVHAHDNGFAGIAAGEDHGWSEDVYIGHCIAENNPGDPLNLDNHSGTGIVAGWVRGCTIEYCEAMNNGWDMPRRGNGPVGIWAWNADRVVIQYCISHDNKSPGWDGGGFDLDGGVTNSILQYNLSYNNVGPGYLLSMYPGAAIWKNNIVRYNISQNDGTGERQDAGIRVYWLDGMSDAEIYHNTIFNEIGAAVDFVGEEGPGFRFRNNILVSGTKLIGGGAHKARFEGNLYWMLNGKPFEVDGYDSLDAWSAATGQETVNGALAGRWADPKLRRPGSVNGATVKQFAEIDAYLPEGDSPCLRAGIPITTNGNQDFRGNPIPDPKKPTIGACER